MVTIETTYYWQWYASKIGDLFFNRTYRLEILSEQKAKDRPLLIFRVRTD